MVGRSPRRTLASLLFALGCLTVLAITFALGMAAGRRWPDGLPLPGFRATATATAAARTERDARRPEARGLDKDKSKTRAEPAPILTFYHELTAPLSPAAAPPRTPTKSDRVEAKPAARADTAKPAAPASTPSNDTSLQDVEGTPPVPASVSASPARTDARFTVQVGAFKARAQAEALRARLAARGQDASLSESEVGGTMQYRVRVGTFATREAAQEAAGRLGSDHRLSTYVTTH